MLSKSEGYVKKKEAEIVPGLSRISSVKSLLMYFVRVDLPEPATPEIQRIEFWPSAIHDVNAVWLSIHSHVPTDAETTRSLPLSTGRQSRESIKWTL